MSPTEGLGPRHRPSNNYIVNFGPKYSTKWALNPFPGTPMRMSVIEGREPSWFHRWTTHWLLGFEWIRLTPKD